MSSSDRNTRRKAHMDIAAMGGMEDREDMATWREVFSACCRHTAAEWAAVLPVWLVCLVTTYFFLVGYELLGSGAKIFSGCQAGTLFGDDQNPLTSLMVGLLVTSFQQSSSTTTGVVISLVAAEAIDVRTGIYIIMGANVGTSVTTVIVSIAHMGNAEQFERAFSGAMLHSLFNMLSVVILFPLECAAGYLFHLTAALVRGSDTEDGESWNGPVKTIVKLLSDRIVIPNKNVIGDVAQGVRECTDFYPIECEDDDNPTYETCEVGMIACSKSTGNCPAFFNPTATLSEDQASGFVCFLLGLFIVFFCVFTLTSMVPALFAGVPKRIIKRGTTMNGYVSIFLGAGFTMLVQSSSIALAFVPPLVGTDLVELDLMLPYTIGANLGTTMSGLLAAMVTDGSEALQVALAHVFFNVTAATIWYSHSDVRKIIVRLARRLGRVTGLWQGFPVLFIVLVYYGIPIYLLVISELFSAKNKVDVIVASILTAFTGAVLVAAIWFWFVRRGRDRIMGRLATRKRRVAAYMTLPDDIDFIRKQLVRLEALCAGRKSKTKVNLSNSNSALSELEEDAEDAGSANSRNSAAAIGELNKKAFMSLHEHMDDITSRLAALANFLGLSIELEPSTYNMANEASSGFLIDGEDNKDDTQSTANNNGRVKGVRRVLAEIPRIYVFVSLGVTALYVWAIVALLIIGSHTADSLAIIMLSIGGFYFLRLAVWWTCRNGEERSYKYWLNRRRRKELRLTLHQDLEAIQEEISLLMTKSGLTKSRGGTRVNMAGAISGQ